MLEIIPAIMPKNREEIESTVLRYLETPVQTIQLDLMDGEFVPGKTWPYKGKNQFQEYKILQEEGFPGWQDIDIELDLMIAHPLEDIEKFIECGPSRIIIHARSVVKEDLQKFLQDNARVQSFIHFGVAFTVEDSIEEFAEILPLVDFVQYMGIVEVGVQGAELDSRIFSCIQNFKKQYPQIPVSVDGGVHAHNAQKLVASGADRLVSGSFLSDSIDVFEALKELGGNTEE